uniref:Uncharacterized protein n=1 Tax=Oryza brachyantha TaxID=4533 RepID=J3M6F7_ORYBR
MMRNDGSPATGSGSNQSSNVVEEAASNIEVVEDPDLVGLRAICVPKRKARCRSSSRTTGSLGEKVSGFLVTLDSWSRGGFQPRSNLCGTWII